MYSTVNIVDMQEVEAEVKASLHDIRPCLKDKSKILTSSDYLASI